jgi:TrmH family RNA methyltransferase
LSERRDVLDRIVIVLWETQDLVNIAATIRAMKNFGLHRLRLVSPAAWDAWRIEGIAHDTGDLVAAAELFDDLESALADCSYVVAMTARGRRAKRAMSGPRDIAGELLDRAETSPEGAPVAVLFGREDAGLPNSALDLCHRSITIPTNPDHKSLNLAQAVLVIAYELWMAAASGAPQEFKRPRRDAPPATVQLIERMFADTETALHAVDFFKTRDTNSVMRTLREVAHRADLDNREASFLRAISIEIVKYIGRIEEKQPEDAGDARNTGDTGDAQSDDPAGAPLVSGG